MYAPFLVNALVASLLLAFFPHAQANIIVARGVPTPTGATKACVSSLLALPVITNPCKSFLAGEGSLYKSATQTVTTTTTLATPTSTTTLTQTQTSYTPTVTATATSTFSTTTETTIPVTTTTTSTAVVSSTTTSTSVVFSLSTPAPKKREEGVTNEADSERRGFLDQATLQIFVDIFGRKTVNDACLFIVYRGSPQPTTTLTQTATATSSPLTVHATATTTTTTSVATTTTTTSTVTEYTSTATIAPTVTATAISTSTSVVTSTSVSTALASKATGMIYIDKGATTNPVRVYSDQYGNFMSLTRVDGIVGTFCYEATTQFMYDCTKSKPGLRFTANTSGGSYVYLGDANNPPIRCTVASANDPTGNTALNCYLDVSSGPQYSNFQQCNGQDALYFPTSKFSCTVRNFYFRPTSYS